MSLKNVENRRFAKWFVLILVSLFFFISLMYDDLNESLIKGYYLIDSILTFNFPGNYSFESALYMPVHLLFGVWCIPIWPFIHFGYLAISSSSVLLWAKLLIVISYIGCIYLTNQLLELLATNNKEFWIFSLASSLVFFIPPFAMATYDSFELLFGLWGFWYVVREHKISNKAIILFSVSASIKGIFVFSIIVILLIAEKNILLLIKKLVMICFIPFVFFLIARIIIKTSPDIESAEMTWSFMHRYFSIQIEGGLYGISTFFVIIFSTFLYAFLTEKPKSEKEFIVKASVLIVVQRIGMFLFVYKNEPQWIVFVVPFIILLIASRPDNLLKNLLLENILELAIVIVQIFYFGWQYMSSNLFNNLLLKDIPTGFILRKDISDGSVILANLGLASFTPIFTALILSVGAAIIILNTKPVKQEIIDYSDNISPYQRLSNFFRLMCIIIYFAVVSLMRFVI